MLKRAQIEISLKWIIRIIFGLTFLVLFISFLYKLHDNSAGLIPWFIIGLLIFGVAIEVIWKIASGTA